MPETERFSSKSEEEREAIVNETIRQFRKPGSGKGTKIVVTGKGGVGKTVLSAALCHLFAMNGSNVLAVDGDPQMNLAPTLGLSTDSVGRITPLNAQLDYIEERVGARPGAGWGGFLTLNPEVDDVVSRFGVKVTEKMRLLVMGTLSKAAVGCLCPENTLLQATVNQMALSDEDVIVMDTEAGVEHFGRAIARGFEHAVVVTDASYNSLSVASDALGLAHDLGIPNLNLVCNRMHDQKDREKVRSYISNSKLGFDFSSFFIPYDQGVYECDPSLLPMLNDVESPFLGSLGDLFDHLRPSALGNRLQVQL